MQSIQEDAVIHTDCGELYRSDNNKMQRMKKRDLKDIS